MHHWDTDGICSARLLLECLSATVLENKTPELGNYFLTNTELEAYTTYDFVIVADMALPKEHILTLAQHAKVVIFDHHLQEEIKEVDHINPVIKGGDPDQYPSASWIINNYLGNTLNLFALLGIVGDHEQRIRHNKKFSRILTDFSHQHNFAFDDLLKMVYLLDSNYKVGDKKAVENAPHILLNSTDITTIFHNQQWNKNLDMLIEEISRQLKQPADEINGTLIKKINTTFNIISTITRKIAWESSKNAIVINTGFFDDRDQVYVRSSKNVEPLIMKGRSLGFTCGGKKEVLGAIVPKEKTNFFLQEILDFLSNKK